MHMKYKCLCYSLFSAWLRDIEDPVIAGISAKVHKITQLSMETVEELQVGNSFHSIYKTFFKFIFQRVL